MTKEKIILGVVIASALLIGAVLWFQRPMPLLVTQAPQPAPSISHPITPTPSPSPVIVDQGGPISLKNMTVTEAMKIYVERLSKDPNYDWKRPINFYGKVVDENNQPVADATVAMNWTTIGIPGGDVAAKTLSNAEGLFSLENQHGKLLEVTVNKEGYYPVERGNGRLDFEYANPSDHQWYEPDSSAPVTFHLRKKGLHAANLLHWTSEQALDDQNKVTFDLKNGRKPDGQSPSIVIEIYESRDSKFVSGGAMVPGAFSARVSIVGGDLQLCLDQFPFMAPINGYQQSLDINLDTPKPPTWHTIYAGGAAFYVQTPQGYGRYEIRTMLGRKTIEVEGYFNPQFGNQNLEPASP